MLRFLLTRASLVIPTFLGIVFITFFLIRLVPGDPIEVRTGERGISPERHAQLLHEMGLDRPLYVQFFSYIGNVLQGDFDKSVITQRPVLDEFFELFPATLELAICAAIFAVIIGLPAGVLAATRRNSIFDTGVMGAAIAGYSMPIFWWGPMLILALSPLGLGLTPVSGRIGAEFFVPRVTGFLTIDSLIAGDYDAFKSALHYLILPTIVLGTIPLAVIARMTRSSMLEVLGEDYVRTARAKGLSPWRVLALHALRNAINPVLTSISGWLASLLAGAFFIEYIFDWQGIGKLMIDALGTNDFPVIIACALLMGLIFTCVSLLTDLLYRWLDPRVRLG